MFYRCQGEHVVSLMGTKGELSARIVLQEDAYQETRKHTHISHHLS